jgi:excisionase family DNA binding protein
MTTVPSAQPAKLLLTPLEAAEALSISRSLLYDLLLRKHIFSVKVGGTRRIPLQALHTYVAELCDHEP